MSRGRVEPEDPTPKDMAYYFTGDQLKAMRKLKPYELWERLAAAYQLAGGLLIGAKLLESDGSRNINGWTDEEIDEAITKLLDFLWCPADVTAEVLEQRAVYRGDGRLQVNGHSEPDLDENGLVKEVTDVQG